jgi:hypothetical protein
MREDQFLRNIKAISVSFGGYSMIKLQDNCSHCCDCRLLIHSFTICLIKEKNSDGSVALCRGKMCCMECVKTGEA